MFYRLCGQENFKVRFNSDPRRGAFVIASLRRRLCLNQVQQRSALRTAERRDVIKKSEKKKKQIENGKA